MDFLRRDFIRSLAILAGGSLLLPQRLSASVLESDVPVWNEEWDLIIIGSGFAGVCAAMTAVEEGVKRILLIDKMPYQGGNSTLAGGLLAAANTDFQRAQGVTDDSPERFFADTMKGGANLNDPELVRIMANEGAGIARWLEGYGVKWVGLGHSGGHSVARSLAGGTGSFILRPIREQEKFRKNVVTRLCVVMDELVYNAQKSVIGIKVRENYNFDYNNPDERSNKTGRVKYYRATGGILLATGGWGADVKFREKMDRRVAGITLTTNHKGATGYTIENLMQDGIKTVDMDQIQLIHLTSADENSFGFGYSFISKAMTHGIMVNTKTGKRFVNEMANRRQCSDAIIAMNEGGKNPPVIIMDSVATAAFALKKKVDKAIEVGAVWKFDTIDEVIAHFNIAKEPFLDQLQRFNDYVKAQHDPEFGKAFTRPKGKIYPVETPPFYASRPAPKVHHCMGGVKTTTACEVLNNSGEVIDGLYAAGELTGGRHGATRLGSNAILDCTLFGRIAAKQAAARWKKMARG